jgi:predicted nucleotidyltransferase/uncharacterized protein (UPF0332 family)
MVKKKKSTKKSSKTNKKSTKKEGIKNTSKNIKTLKLQTDQEIATDFAVKTYKKFDKIIKSIILFGSVEKKEIKPGSDIDIIVIIDDISLNWDQELIAWYREELGKILQMNPYKGNIHINTIKLSTWWDDLLKGDPVVLNVIRHGFAILDYGGFFEPLKFLLLKGKIKGTPEAVYQCIQRAPGHISRSKAAELAAIDGVYWSMVDAAHAALIAANYFPPSPEHVITDLKEAFVDKGFLKMKYLIWYKDIYYLYKKIDHKEISDLKGVEIDMWQQRAEEFLKVMVNLVEKIIGS